MAPAAVGGGRDLRRSNVNPTKEGLPVWTSGTLITPDGDIPPTNRTASARGVQIQRIANDKIAEEHVCFDQLELLTQLGLLPEPANA